MYTPLGIKTDYSLLKSLIKIEDLISYAIKNNISSLGICDNNLCSSHLFYNKCIENNIKPIIGLDIIIDEIRVIFYPRHFKGLSNLFKLLKKEVLSIGDLKAYQEDVIVLLPFESHKNYELFNNIFEYVFLGFESDEEELICKLITDNVIYFKDIYGLDTNSIKYLNYLTMIDKNLKLGDMELVDYSKNVLTLEKYDTSKLTDLIDIEFDKTKRYIPIYDANINSEEYLTNLAYKGLNKRLNNNIPDKYKNRLDYELKVIKEMGFTDYFLIVFDYVKYAIKNGIFVGAGRGSAAGSLVAYSLGITMIDPLKYNLLFERFLNPERVTMPDIDVDFEDTRKEEVVDYVKKRYGSDYVGHIMTYGTLTAKEVLRSVGKINNVPEIQLNDLIKLIDSKLSLKDNLTKEVKNLLEINNILKKVYKEAFYLEGIKRHIGTHAAGVVISSVPLTNLIPVIKSGDEYLTGYTMNELEELGLIKMDFLSIKNLTILTKTLNDIKDTGVNININKIPLNDPEVYQLFSNADTVGIFQFEKPGMKNFLKKLKPTCFDDLIMALAIYRPGPMQSIDEYLKRKNEGKKIEYLDPILENTLKSTYGILIYQEQIMEILRIMGDFSYAEADIIRRGISKKKLNVIEDSREKFINNAQKKGHTKEIATEVFELIVKFADFGFNKSHSVAYAFIAYQMAYLKVHYSEIYYINLLNVNIGGEAKTKEYIDSAKRAGIKILKPDINLSKIYYSKESDGIRLPLRVIKGVGSINANEIINLRTNDYLDFFDFVSRTNLNKNILINLIDAGVFDSFGYNHNTLKKNLDASLTYASLIKDLDASLVNKPEMVIVEEDTDINLMNKEMELFGYYVSNHPASKYPDYFKQIDIVKNYNKRIKTVVLIEKINKIKTKNNKDMAFITASDETIQNDYVLFDINLIKDIKVGDLVLINGLVERRMDKYQIIINQMNKI